MSRTSRRGAFARVCRHVYAGRLVPVEISCQRSIVVVGHRVAWFLWFCCEGVGDWIGGSLEVRRALVEVRLGYGNFSTSSLQIRGCFD